jgi:hypothetical protein
MGNCASQSSSQISANASPSRTSIDDTGTGGRSSSAALNVPRRQSSRVQSQQNGVSNHSSRQNKDKNLRKKSFSEEELSKWRQIFEKEKNHIVDPFDVHTILDTSISKCINRLHSAETTLILRRVRKVVATFVKNTNQKSVLEYAYGNGNGKKKVPLDDITSSKAVYQKSHLLDMNLFRMTFIAGDRWLARGREEGWMHKSLELYLTQKKHTDESGRSNGNGEKVQRQMRVSAYGTEQEKKRVGNNGHASKGVTDVRGTPGDLIGAAFTLLLHLSENRWDSVQAVAISSAEQAGMVLDVNKSIDDSARNTKNVPSPPPLNPFEREESFVAHPPDLPDGVSFKDLCYLISFSLRCNRKQRLYLLFYLLLGSEKLREILQKHPAGGIPSWIMEYDESWRLSYASIGHEYYFQESIKVDARVAIETIGILLHKSPPQLSKENMDSVQKSTNGNRKRVLSHGDGKYNEAKMHVMLSDYLRSVRSGNDTPVFENAEEQKKMNDSIEIFWDASHDIYSHLQMIDCASKMGHDSSDSHYWTFDEFVTWADMAVPEDGTLDNIMHQAFSIGLLPTPAMERQLVADSWIDWQKKQMYLWGRNTDDDHGGSILAVTNSIRSLLNFPNRDVSMTEQTSDEVDEELYITRNGVWGGIGGFDGRGGLGHGIMYCIDKNWWLQWMAYVGWCWNDGSHDYKKRSRIRPRELSNEILLNQSSDSFIRGTMGTYELMKEGVKKDSDYILIPPPAWDILYELYAGGPPLPRMVIGRSFQNISVDIPVRDALESPKRIPRSLNVATHPWVIECQVSFSKFFKAFFVLHLTLT